MRSAAMPSVSRRLRTLIVIATATALLCQGVAALASPRGNGDAGAICTAAGIQSADGKLPAPGNRLLKHCPVCMPATSLDWAPPPALHGTGAASLPRAQGTARKNAPPQAVHASAPCSQRAPPARS